MKRILCSDWPILPALIPTSSRSIKTQKRELGQYPAILTSSLVDNAYFTARKNHQHLNSIEEIIDLQCTIFFLSYSQNLPSWVSYWTSAEFFGRVSEPVHMFSPFIYRYKDWLVLLAGRKVTKPQPNTFVAFLKPIESVNLGPSFWILVLYNDLKPLSLFYNVHVFICFFVGNKPACGYKGTFLEREKKRRLKKVC